jgi:hypothetical protein
MLNLLLQFGKVFLCIILVSFVVFVSYWVQQDQYVYYWDSAGYWTVSIDRMNYIFSHSFVENIKSLRVSINSEDYNVFLPSVVALPLRVFGYTYAKYVLICCTMFLIPSFVVQGLTVSKMIQNTALSKGVLFVTAIALAALGGGNYYAIFRGYIDAAYLLPMSVVMYLFVDYDFRRVSITRNIAIAMMLVMIWVSRRYTIFFLIGFVMSMVVKALVVVMQDKGLTHWKSIVINFLWIGCVSLGSLLLFVRNFVLRALLTSYGEMYSAYDAELPYKIHTLAATFGYVTGVLVVAIGVICWRSKKQRVNYISLLVLIFVETVVFWQTQAMGIQHRMLLNIPLYLICAMIFEQWPTNEGVQKAVAYGKKATVVVCLLLLAANFVKAFSNDFSTRGCGTWWSERYYPLQRGDIDTLEQLASEMNELTEETEETIYIAASGNKLNSDILKKLHMPDTENAVPQMLDTYDVDLRDGFPPYFIQATYVVTTDPVQTHLASGQEVVTYLASNVQDSESYIGRHYECIDQFELDGGVTAKLYRKVSEYTEEDIDQMRAYYTELYPGYESMFADRMQLG